ncbi:MAG: hypothetical protein HZB81_05200 [Deltaproteobacteria bacterium]|nr:hypothetical protein [Deltaproteobacteria bacterium]
MLAIIPLLQTDTFAGISSGSVTVSVTVVDECTVTGTSTGTLSVQCGQTTVQAASTTEGVFSYTPATQSGTTTQTQTVTSEVTMDTSNLSVTDKYDTVTTQYTPQILKEEEVHRGRCAKGSSGKTVGVTVAW